MIFVTVGTHEQQFNRLVEYVDKLKLDGLIEEDVVIQTGFSTYEPKACKWSKLYSYQEMIKYINKARIVITHGGPSSFIMPLQIGKIPIVVPRKYEYDEHVNDHQVEFCSIVYEKQKNIIVIDNIDELSKTIHDYDKLVVDLNNSTLNNNARFNMDFEEIVASLFKS